MKTWDKTCKFPAVKYADCWAWNNVTISVHAGKAVDTLWFHNGNPRVQVFTRSPHFIHYTGIQLPI